MGSTAARYLIQQIIPRTYTLEYTIQALVSDSVHIRYLVLLQCFKVRVKVKVNNARLISEAKAVDKRVLGRAEAPPNFYVNRISGLAFHSFAASCSMLHLT